MSEERVIQLVAEVDTTRTGAGFNEIARQGESMAGQVARSGEQAQRAVSNIGEGAGRSAQSVDAAQRNIIGSIQRTTAAMQAGSRSGAEYYEVLARQRGVDPAVLEPYLAQLRAVESAQRQGGMSANAYAAAMRNVPAQMTDIFTSLQGGMPVFTVIMQQGGQLRDMFGGIVPAARALGTQLLSMVNPYTLAAAAVAGLGVAYYQGSKEGDAFARSLALTGNAAGTSTGQMANMAKEVSKVVGTQGAAAAALAALSGTGRVGADNLREFAAASVKAQQAIGVAVADTAEEFSNLGKSPLQAIVKLDDQYHFLTAAVYAQIKALEDQGRTDDAAEVAQKAYAEAIGSRADKIKEHLGTMERTWDGVMAAAKGAWDAMLNVGREETLEDKLATVQAKIAKASTAGASSLRTRDARADLQGNLVLERLLQGQIKLAQQEAAAEGEANKKREAAVEWEKQLNANLSRQKQLDNELASNTNRGRAAGASEKQIAEQAAIIRKKYSDIYNDGINSQIEAIKRRGEIEDTVARRSLDLLTANRAAGLVSEEAYTKGVAEFELAAIAKRKQQLQQELALTVGKQNSQKDQAALRGEIAKQDELATTRQLQLTNDLNTQRANGEREVSKQLKESALQRTALVASLATEYQMYGKSADARELAAVSLKSEAELQKKIADAILAKKPLSDDAIAQLRAEKDALDEVTKSVLAQKKALGYASQLRDENDRFKAESLPDPKARADAILEIDAKVWRERVKLAGEGTEAQRMLQAEFDTWYSNQQRKIGTEVDLARATNLVNIMQAVDAAARQAAQGMTDSFGSVGKAIGSLTTSLTGYQSAQAAVAAQLAASIQASNGDPGKIEKARAVAAQQSAQAQIKSYGDMASAAKGFFGENSKGYKALEVAEKTFRAFEMAMSVESMVQKLFAVNAVTTATVAGEATKSAAVQAGTAAQLAADAVKGTSAAAVGVATQAQGDPYTAWARMAAMAAAMAALGFAVFGSGGGGADISKQRQDAAGTGSVLGDSSAKSKSISRAIELAAANSSIELTHTAGMLASLKNIESTIGGLGNLLVRTSGLTGQLSSGSKGAAADFFTSTAGTVVLAGVFAPIVMAADKLLGGFISKITGSIANSIFGGKVTTLDTGVTITAESLASVLEQGVTARQYTDIKKDGGLFHSDKYSTQYSDLGAEADAQFTKVIMGLADSVTTAANLLGVGGDAFTEHLNSFVVDIGKISLKGMTGDQIQEALETVFSKLGDDMAQFGVAGLEKFQQVGEGYFETLTRIATDYANLNSIMESIGATFGQTGMASIEARERLIELTGGIDELASQTNSFSENFLTKAEQLAPVQKYVTDQLAAMGLQSLDTRDKFKEYVLGLANSGMLATEAGAQQYAALLALSDAFAKTHAATVDLTKTEQDIADERSDLQNQYDELTMTQAQLAANARAAIDEHNLALYDEVVAAQAAKDASTKLVDGLSTAYSNLSTVISAQKDALNAAYTDASDALQTGIDSASTSVTKLTSLSQSLQSTLDSMSDPGQDAALRQAAQAKIEAALAIAKAGGPLPDADSLKTALSVVSKDASSQFATALDYQRDLYRTKNAVAALGALTDSKLSAEESALQVLKDQKDALAAAHKEEISALDKQLAAAKQQVDLLSGISTSLLTLPDALKALAVAVASAQKDSGVGTDSLTSLYQTLLGRAPDAAGLAYWQNVLAGGASITDIAKGIMSDYEYKGLHSSTPAFAAGGDHLGGLRLVGENGPELEATGPSRIFNANQTRSMLGSANEELLAEVRSLRAVMSELRLAADKTASNTETVSKVMKRAGGQGDFIVVKQAKEEETV